MSTLPLLFVPLEVVDMTNPNEVLNSIDHALDNQRKDPENTPEDELKLMSRCHKLEQTLHRLYTPEDLVTKYLEF